MFDSPMTTPRIPTGREIRQAREARSWTQDELAAAVHSAGYPMRVRQNTISSIENGRSVPRRMTAPLLRALPELAADDEDLAEAG